MRTELIPLIAALIAAISTVSALVFGKLLDSRAQRRARLLEISLSRCDAQIGKLYAPLANLIEQLDVTDEVKIKMIKDDPDRRSAIEHEMYHNHFAPIHAKIADIMSQQMHLLEGDQIPPSFISYYGHVASERVFYSLRDRQTARMEALPPGDPKFSPIAYPEPQFRNDIQTGFKSVLKHQDELLTSMKQEGKSINIWSAFRNAN